jgi:hypothetical protein
LFLLCLLFKGSKARIIPDKICGYILKAKPKAKPITPIPAVLKIMPYLALALKHNKVQYSGLQHKLQLRIIVLFI